MQNFGWGKLEYYKLMEVTTKKGGNEILKFQWRKQKVEEHDFWLKFSGGEILKETVECWEKIFIRHRRVYIDVSWMFSLGFVSAGMDICENRKLKFNAVCDKVVSGLFHLRTLLKCRAFFEKVINQHTWYFVFLCREMETQTRFNLSDLYVMFQTVIFKTVLFSIIRFFSYSISSLFYCLYKLVVFVENTEHW